MQHNHIVMHNEELTDKIQVTTKGYISILDIMSILYLLCNIGNQYLLIYDIIMLNITLKHHRRNVIPIPANRHISYILNIWDPTKLLRILKAIWKMIPLSYCIISYCIISYLIILYHIISYHIISWHLEDKVMTKYEILYICRNGTSRVNEGKTNHIYKSHRRIVHAWVWH